MNQVNLVGRLVKDPQLKRFENGAIRATFSLAVSREYKSKNNTLESDFIFISTWDKLAEIVERYCHKGMLVSIVGRIQTRSYDDNEGKRQFISEVVGEKVRFLAKNKHTQPTDSTTIQEDTQFETDLIF